MKPICVNETLFPRTHGRAAAQASLVPARSEMRKLRQFIGRIENQCTALAKETCQNLDQETHQSKAQDVQD